MKVEELEDKLDNLIDQAESQGMSLDDIISTLELALERTKERKDE